MNNAKPSESFVSLRRVAAHLGVPISWLKDEAEAGRVPHLKTGRRLLLNVEEVERVLKERAQREGKS